MSVSQPRAMARRAFLALVLLISFSCMTYELMLAQTMAVLLGHTLLRYTLTIGLYLASLGCGALLVKRSTCLRMARQLFGAEVALVVFGGLSPVVAVVGDAILRSAHLGAGTSYLLYSLATIVGVISGCELPLVIHIAEDLFQMKAGHVLAVDYVGTLAGVIAFPFFLLPGLGLFGTAAAAAFLSAVCGAAIPGIIGNQEKKWSWGFCAAGLAIFALVFMVENEALARWLVATHYLRSFP